MFDSKLVMKNLKFLFKRFPSKVTIIEESNDIDKFKFDKLVGISKLTKQIVIRNRSRKVLL